jgi:hypothetical protein
MTETFSWDHPGLDEHGFRAFIALLRLRNGGIVATDTKGRSHVPTEDELHDDESDDNASETSFHTDRNDQLTNTTNDGLKVDFLDSIAELASNEKGARGVAAAAMLEEEDEIRIWIAKNNGFVGKEEEFFHELSELLAATSSADDNGEYFLHVNRVDTNPK